MLTGWMEAFSGFVLHHRNAGKITKFGAMKWSTVTQLSAFLEFKILDCYFSFGHRTYFICLYFPDRQFPFCQNPGLS